jgi:putative ABC transport system permease protein
MKAINPPKSLLRPSRRTKRKISLLEIFLMAVETLWSNKVRSGLTMLGVIIGISSVIAITSIGQGVQKATELQIQALGTNILQVSPASARTGGISQGAGSAKFGMTCSRHLKIRLVRIFGFGATAIVLSV